ncbi:winged helix-turn-helix transcriptional regulator, partial [Hungatella effluvii]|uniref:winged helix-turn-helix transcriptional regulator n=1 Tax=Hungatella effluvii TaxID=1096246 RepID=UPI002A7F3FFE
IEQSFPCSKFVLDKGYTLEKMKIQKMEERKEKILSLIKANPSITQGEIMEKLNLSRKQVQSLMKLLNNQGQIRRIGSNRNGYWEVS